MKGMYRVNRFGRKIRRIFVPGSAIIMYHRIVETDTDPYMLAVSPDNFFLHMEYIRENYSVIRLKDLGKAIAEKNIPKRSIVVTFDDSYSSILDKAKPILDKFDIPSTIFVISNYIGNNREFWWNDLERVFLETECIPSYLTLVIRGKKLEWSVDSKVDKDSVRKDIYTYMRSLRHTEKNDLIDEIIEWAGLEKSVRADYRTLNCDEILTLSQNGLMDFGAHTMTHPTLSKLPKEEQMKEIVGGRQALEQIIGKPISMFSYPYGTAMDYSNETVSLVKEANFSLACTTIPGCNEAGEDLYQLKRFGIYNWDINTFIREIDEFFMHP